MWDGGQVDDGVGDGVGAAEGEDDAWFGGRVRERDVAAGVAEEGAGVPGLRGARQLDIDIYTNTYMYIYVCVYKRKGHPRSPVQSP